MTCRVVGTRVLTTLTVLNDRAGRNVALCRGYSRGVVLASTVRSVVLAGARCCAAGRGHNSPAGDWCHTATRIVSCAAMVVSARKTVTHPENFRPPTWPSAMPLRPSAIDPSRNFRPPTSVRRRAGAVVVPHACRHGRAGTPCTGRSRTAPRRRGRCLPSRIVHRAVRGARRMLRIGSRCANTHSATDCHCCHTHAFIRTS